MHDYNFFNLATKHETKQGKAVKSAISYDY